MPTANDKRHKEEKNPRCFRELFRAAAHHAAEAVGSAWAFLIAATIVIAWGVSGPLFHYSDTWQLFINTGTTIITFLMVFLIQNSQNRDSKALHLKLDELIRALEGARNHLVNLEALSDDELMHLEKEFTRLQRRADRAEKKVEAVQETTPR